MAGTLTISTLSDGTNSTSSTNCIQGSAKAWVQFTGSTGAVRASYNVSSVTRSSTGTFLINMTNAMSDANYSVIGTCGAATAGNLSYFASAPNTASQAYFNTWAAGVGSSDYVNNSVAIFR